MMFRPEPSLRIVVQVCATDHPGRVSEQLADLAGTMRIQDADVTVRVSAPKPGTTPVSTPPNFIGSFLGTLQGLFITGVATVTFVIDDGSGVPFTTTITKPKPLTPAMAQGMSQPLRDRWHSGAPMYGDPGFNFHAGVMGGPFFGQRPCSQGPYGMPRHGVFPIDRLLWDRMTPRCTANHMTVIPAQFEDHGSHVLFFGTVLSPTKSTGLPGGHIELVWNAAGEVVNAPNKGTRHFSDSFLKAMRIVQKTTYTADDQRLNIHKLNTANGISVEDFYVVDMNGVRHGVGGSADLITAVLPALEFSVGIGEHHSTHDKDPGNLVHVWDRFGFYLGWYYGKPGDPISAVMEPSYDAQTQLLLLDC